MGCGRSLSIRSRNTNTLGSTLSGNLERLGLCGLVRRIIVVNTFGGETWGTGDLLSGIVVGVRRSLHVRVHSDTFVVGDFEQHTIDEECHCSKRN